MSSLSAIFFLSLLTAWRTLGTDKTSGPGHRISQKLLLSDLASKAAHTIFCLQRNYSVQYTKQVILTQRNFRFHKTNRRAHGSLSLQGGFEPWKIQVEEEMA